MEQKLKLLFDYQRFQGNPRLSKLIDEVDAAENELNLEELNLVNAAGEAYEAHKDPESQ